MKNVNDNGEFRKATIEETRLGGWVWQDGCRYYLVINLFLLNVLVLM